MAQKSQLFEKKFGDEAEVVQCPFKSLHSEAWQAVFLPNLLLMFGFIVNYDSLTIIYLWMRQVQQCQFFRIFQQKVPSVVSNISLGQFGQKRGSERTVLWALLHRRKLLNI